MHLKLIGAPGEVGEVSLVNDPTPFKVVPATGGDIVELSTPAFMGVADTIMLGGRVLSFGLEDYPVAGATVTIDDGSGQQSLVTGNDGSYEFTVNSGAEAIFTVANSSHVKANRGVDVADIIELRNHILNRRRMPSPAQRIAADVNRDLAIDVADIIEMRKVILNRTDTFPSMKMVARRTYGVLR